MVEVSIGTTLMERDISTYWKCKNIYTPYSIILIPRVYLKEKMKASSVNYLIVYL